MKMTMVNSGLKGLTLTTLKYICINHGDHRVNWYMQFEIIINILVSSFRFVWIPMLSTTVIMGMRPWSFFYFFRAGIVFIRQNLTSTDVRFWRIKTVPALKYSKPVNTESEKKNMYLKLSELLDSLLDKIVHRQACDGDSGCDIIDNHDKG